MVTTEIISGLATVRYFSLPTNIMYTPESKYSTTQSSTSLVQTHSGVHGLYIPISPRMSRVHFLTYDQTILGLCNFYTKKMP